LRARARFEPLTVSASHRGAAGPSDRSRVVPRRRMARFELRLVRYTHVGQSTGGPLLLDCSMPHRLRGFWEVSLAGLVYLILHGNSHPVVLTRQGSSSHTTCVGMFVTVEVTLAKTEASDVRVTLQLLF
jgi:hypothetical protein